MSVSHQSLVKLAFFNSRSPINQFFSWKRTIQTISRYSEIQVDEAIDPSAELRQFKNHAGKYMSRGIKLPDYLELSINDVLSDENIPNLREESRQFREKLSQRDTLYEKNRKKYRHVVEKYKQNIYDPDNIELIGFGGAEKLEKEIDQLLHGKNKDKLEYRHKESLLYLASRFAFDYSSLFQIFTEIKKRHASFQPKRLFDFGSGVGTAMWAANTLWDAAPIETFNLDTSVYMNSTAEAVIRKCKIKKPFFKHVKFKRNLPTSLENEFDLVTCSFALLDLPNRLSRLENIEKLWKAVVNDGYLVIVENGHPNGFDAINEIRDFFINELFKLNKGDPSSQLNGHIFSPCPHHLECPLARENKICKFKVSHKPLAIYDFLSMRNDYKEYPYSFIVLKKSPKPDESNWHRFVLKNPQNTKKSSYNSWICRSDVSRVDNLVSTKARHKTTNWLVRYSKAGDRLPISIKDYVKQNEQDEAKSDDQDIHEKFDKPQSINS